LYEVEHYVEAFEEVRRKLGARRWFICGQSFGAGLTLQYSFRFPERVIGQIFTNSRSALSHQVLPTATELKMRVDAILAGGHAEIELLPFHPRYAKRISPEIKTEMIRDAERIAPLAIANAMRYTAPRLSVADRLHLLSVPTLLVNGIWERAFQPLRAEAETLSQLLEVVDLDGGHSINAEAPSRFNEVTRSFITRLMAVESCPIARGSD
jgi:pimeloyl-ACP methyl ester carboxylesterase